MLYRSAQNEMVGPDTFGVGVLGGLGVDVGRTRVGVGGTRVGVAVGVGARVGVSEGTGVRVGVSDDVGAIVLVKMGSAVCEAVG